jgi:LCP family protein required for cell wall assembly
LTFCGFLFSGVIGTGVYFYPALNEAVQATGHKVDNPVDAIQGLTAASPGAPFTVLLLGSDNDAKFANGQVLTQSMILVRVIPDTKKVTMLSIPRDLYVPLSTGGTDKIDKAYLNGGASAAIQTVEKNFRVHIDHYIWVGLQGLVQIIDKVGGVNVVATNPVVDDFYPADISGSNPYAFQRVAVLPGAQHMDGVHALEYVRSRHGDLRGDFGRSERQQQVLLALQTKAKQFGAADIPNFASALNGELTTDMSISDINSLLPLAQNQTLHDAQRILLLPPNTGSAQIGGQDVLLPVWNSILPLVHQNFPQV